MMRFSRNKDGKKDKEKKLTRKEKKQRKEKQVEAKFVPLFTTSMFVYFICLCGNGRGFQRDAHAFCLRDVKICNLKLKKIFECLIAW